MSENRNFFLRPTFLTHDDCAFGVNDKTLAALRMTRICIRPYRQAQ